MRAPAMGPRSRRSPHEISTRAILFPKRRARTRVRARGRPCADSGARASARGRATRRFNTLPRAVAPESTARSRARMSLAMAYGAIPDAGELAADARASSASGDEDRGRRSVFRTRFVVVGVACAAVASACAIVVRSGRTDVDARILVGAPRASAPIAPARVERAALGCEDQVCKSVCPNDIGLQRSYRVSPPKVCGKAAGIKVCLSVPSLDFDLPWSCGTICVPVPGYCAALSASNKFTAVTQATSAQALISLNALQSSVKTEIENAKNDAQKFTALATKTTVDGLVSAGTLNGQLMSVISDAQGVLENIASTLEDKLKEIVGLAWGEMAKSAGDLQAIIESGLLDVVGAASASASLGSSRDKSELYADIKGALRKAFSGEEVELSVESRTTSERATLGSSGRGSCFDMVLTTHNDYSEASYLMPWPEKLKDDSFAPGSLLVKFPSYTTSLCANIQKFNIPSDVAVKIFSAFANMFDEFFKTLYEETGLKTLVNDVKDLGNGKFFGGRRLLSAEDERRFVELHLKYREQLNLAEADVYNEIVKFHERLTSPTLGSFATGRETASLGAGSFDDILIQFANDLKEALKLMTSRTSAEGTFTMAFKSETSLRVKGGTTQTGEFLSEIMGLENSFEKVKVIPTPVPGLFLAVDLKVSLNLPYFLRVDAAGEFGVSVEVSFPVDVKISDSPSVDFRTPTVKAKVLGSYEIVAGLQVGVVAQIEHAYVAVCAGAVCAGPQLWARQDVYYGMDAFAASLDRSRATCDKEARSLTALWNDWDYPTSTKSTCTASATGIGGYLQVPKAKLAVRMMMKPIPSAEESGGISGEGKDDGSGALMPSPALQLYDFTPHIQSAYNMNGNWYMQELFSTCTEPNIAAPRGCAPTCPASIKLKQMTGAAEYKNRCITADGGKYDSPRTAPCEADAVNAAGRQSQWWQIIPDAAGGSRIRLADSFLCLQVQTVSWKGGYVLTLENCDAKNTAQLLEIVKECYKEGSRTVGCIRTASGNSINSSHGKQLYVHGWASSKSRAVDDSYLDVSTNQDPTTQPYGLWDFSVV